MSALVDTKLSRRAVLQTATVGATGISPALRATVYAQGSDKPEKEEVKIGFIPLTDCASIVMASVLGIEKKIRRENRAHQRVKLGQRARQAD